jgi:hypothetical protein
VTALSNAIVPVLAAGGVPVGVGKRPAVDGTKPFVVIWPDGGVRSAITMQANDGNTETWVCHCYGLTPESAGIAEQKLAAAIYGTVPHGRQRPARAVPRATVGAAPVAGRRRESPAV